MMAGSDDETVAHSPPPASPALPAGGLRPGTVLNGIYRIEGRLGAGGMGEVYRATNLANDEVDAIKIIGRGRVDQTLIEAMFRKEARVLSRIHSPAVARLKLFMRDPELDLLYFVTEFVPGESLLDRLKRQPASGDELRVLLRRVLTGLQAVHEAGAVHRDLSPDNIILPNGDVAQAKIIDFGIAKELDPAHTTMVGDSFAGKLSYIAPEQLGFSGARIGPWTDLYSLALVMIAFAAGKPADMGATVGRAEEARREQVDLSSIPDDLRSPLEKLLTYDWHDRPQSSQEALDLFETERHIQVPGFEYKPDSRSTIVNPKRLTTVGAALVTAVAVAVFAVTHVPARPAAHPTPSANKPERLRIASLAGSWILGRWVVDKARNGCAFAITVELSSDHNKLIFTSDHGRTQTVPFEVIIASEPTLETANYLYQARGKSLIIVTSRRGIDKRTLEKCAV